MASRTKIVTYLNDLLRVSEIEDTSRNGLQVEGAAQVRRVGLAVDACLASYKKAVAGRCQMLVVHHGLIWEGIKSVSGHSARHVKFLLSHGLNLYAAHLPLDIHPELGNNAMLFKTLDLTDRKPFGLYHGINVGLEGVLPRARSIKDLAAALQKRLGGKPLVLPFGKKLNRRIALCTGGGACLLREAADKQADCYITGEPEHWNHHAAMEAGLNVIYLGHYWSEQLGVQEVGRQLRREFDVQTVFLGQPTIV
jgi:dinuclear metal center YbgI/SA1388 family protein